MPNYIKDPNDSNKQVPGPKSDQHFDRFGSPTRCGLQKQPHYVMISETPTNDIAFYFGSSGSYSEDATSQAGMPAQGVNHGGLDGAPTGSVITSSFYEAWGKPAAGSILHINPCAWSGSKVDDGKVKFIYRGGLDGMGRIG